MSLDIYLNAADDACPHCGGILEWRCVYSANITHNLGRMADGAGLYLVLWHPEENGISKAAQLIEPLKTGIAKMEADPEHFSKLNASNGWGLYEHFVPWLKALLVACEEYPEASVESSR